MSREKFKRPPQFTDETPVRDVGAVWTVATRDGSCNGCSARGRVALLRFRSLTLRACAGCMNTINDSLTVTR